MQPVNSFVCTVDVPNVDEYFAKALAAGGSAAVPKMPVPGIGWLAYVKDTEGNIVGMMQMDPRREVGTVTLRPESSRGALSKALPSKTRVACATIVTTEPHSKTPQSLSKPPRT